MPLAVCVNRFREATGSAAGGARGQLGRRGGGRSTRCVRPVGTPRGCRSPLRASAVCAAAHRHAAQRRRAAPSRRSAVWAGTATNWLSSGGPGSRPDAMPAAGSTPSAWRLTGAERRMHAALAALTRAIRHESTATDGSIWLMLALLHKRALSSPYALAASAERRLQMLGERGRRQWRRAAALAAGRGGRRAGRHRRGAHVGRSGAARQRQGAPPGRATGRTPRARLKGTQESFAVFAGCSTRFASRSSSSPSIATRCCTSATRSLLTRRSSTVA